MNVYVESNFVLQLALLQGGVASCFLNADARDFDDPNIVAELAGHHCKLIFRFDDGLRYLGHARPTE